MTRNQKIKFYSIFVVLAICLWMLWPSLTMMGKSKAEMESLRIEDPKRYNKLLDKSLRLGLDLQGGTYLVLEVDLEGVPEQDRGKTVDQALQIIRNRVDQFGVAEPTITKEGDNRVVVELPGLPDVERAKSLINTTALLELKLVATQGELFSALNKIDTMLKSRLAELDMAAAGRDSTAAAPAAADSAGQAISFLEGVEDQPAESGEGGGLLALMRGYENGGVFIYKDDVPKVKRYIGAPTVRAAIPSGFQFLWGSEDVSDPSGRKARILYLCNSRVELSGKNLQGATPEPDPERPNSWQVAFTLDRRGASQFATVTERNVGRQLATILDNQVFLAPVIQSRIPQGRGVITGRFTAEEAQDNAILLRAGALPATMHLEEERTVGPSLGRDSINKSMRAALIGFLLVAAFMIFYYRACGLLAVIAMMMNVVIVMAAMSYLHATLTMPGIAGLILMMGMAVDANVLVYERIREELRAGGREGRVRRAIAAGYDRAFSAIFDSNLTTLITGLALYVFGTGPIKGFAVTLSLGIVASMYTALMVTHAIFDFINARRPMEKLSI